MLLCFAIAALQRCFDDSGKIILINSEAHHVGYVATQGTPLFGKGLSDFGSNFKKDVGKLFGMKPAKSNKAPKTGTAKAYKGKPEKGAMHPSNLGKLNGYLNSSPNAKLAHIANGQYMKGTGPVSMAAALTVAKYELGEEVHDYAEAYGFVDKEAALEDAKETLHLDAAYTVLDENPDVDIDEAREIANSDSPDIDPEEKMAAQEFTDAYDKVAEYEGNGGTRADNDAKVEDAESISEAHDTVTMKEDEALAHYKGDFDSLSPDEQDQVRQALHDSLPQDDTEIQAALDKYDAKYGTEEDGEMDSEYGEDGEMTEDGTDSAMIDETEPSEG